MLASLGVASSVAWSLEAVAGQAIVATSEAVLVVLATSIASVFAWREASVEPFELRWSGAQWLLDACDGELSVALDAGAFLLLRHVASSDGAARWLPVQRRGHEADWHRFVCTIHGARRASAATVTTPSLTTP